MGDELCGQSLYFWFKRLSSYFPSSYCFMCHTSALARRMQVSILSPTVHQKTPTPPDLISFSCYAHTFLDFSLCMYMCGRPRQCLCCGEFHSQISVLIFSQDDTVNIL